MVWSSMSKVRKQVLLKFAVLILVRVDWAGFRVIISLTQPGQGASFVSLNLSSGYHKHPPHSQQNTDEQ